MQFSTLFQAWLPLLVATLSLVSFPGQAQVADPAWASVQRATSSTNDLSSGQKVVAAPDGSRFLYGQFEGSLTFGGTTLTAGAGESHFFLAKINPNGSLAWVRQAEEGSSTSQVSVTLAVDATGNVYLGGYFGVSYSLGSLVFTSASGRIEGFVVKLDPQGQPLWSKTAGVTNGDAYVGGLATDAAGNVYVSGDFVGTLDFGGGTANQLTTTTSSIFLYKFSPDGVPLWARQAGGIDNSFTHDLAADAAGNTYLTGRFIGSSTFGTITLNSPTGEDADLYVAKFDTQGSLVWAQRAGTDSDDLGLAIAVDAAGMVAVGGYVNRIQPAASPEEHTAYLARFGPDGTPLWSRQITPSVAAGYKISGMAYDGRGGLYVVSSYSGTLTLGATTLTASRISPFVARYDGQGNALWVGITTPSAPADRSFFLDVSIDAAGNAYLTGGVQGNVSFGPVATTGPNDAAFEAKLTGGGTITSTRSKAANLPLAAYPNPASERATLVLPHGGGQLAIIDALGRTVRTQALPTAAGTCPVSLAGLMPGMYYLRAMLGNGQAAATRLLVR